MEELYGTRYQSGSFSLINVGSGFHCLRSFFSPQGGGRCRREGGGDAGDAGGRCRLIISKMSSMSFPACGWGRGGGREGGGRCYGVLIVDCAPDSKKYNMKCDLVVSRDASEAPCS